MAAVAFVGNMIAPGGTPASGCKLNSYIRNTTTRSPLYSDVGLATPTTNPFVGDADGRLSFYFNDTIEYDWSVTTSDGATTLWEAEIVGGVLTVTYANGILIDTSWAAPLAADLGDRWAAHLGVGLNAIHTTEQTSATAQAKINAADDGAAGLAIVLEKTAAPTAAADNLSLGRSVLGAPGGSTYSPVSASDVTLLKATGSGTSRTLASNISAMSDYIPVTSVTGATVGMWVLVINPVASPVVARCFGAMIDHVDTTNNRLYLSQKTPWAMTTGAAPTIVLLSSPYENAKFDDIIVDGAGLTGEDAQGFALYSGRNVHVGRVEGRNLYGSRPWDRTVASLSRAVDIFRIHGGYFQDLRASFCGGYNGGSINVNQSFNCHFDSIYSEDGLEDGPLIQNSKGISINALRSLGTRSQHSARAFKFEGVDGFFLGYGVADKHLGTGPGFLFGSRGYVAYLETTRPGIIGDVVSAEVTANVATVTFNIPHRAEVNSVINFSGFSDANMNGDKTVTEIVGSFLTSTQLKFAVTTSDGSKGGTPVVVNQNPTVWIASGKNRLHFGHLRIDGAGRADGGDGSDIYVTTDDVVVIDVLEADATPTYVGGGAAGTNYIVRGSIINGVWQPGLITHINRFSAANKFVYGSTSGVATEADITAGARTMLAAVTVSPVTPLTVATLPAGTAGQRSFVTDANATTFASIVAGGGANGVPVYHDGTNWRIG